MIAETTSPVNRALDWAECRGGWLPFVAGMPLGVVPVLLLLGVWQGWIVLAAALVLLSMRPVGTSVRRALLLRQARRMVAARHLES